MTLSPVAVEGIVESEYGFVFLPFSSIEACGKRRCNPAAIGVMFANVLTIGISPEVNVIELPGESPARKRRSFDVNAVVSFMFAE